MLAKTTIGGKIHDFQGLKVFLREPCTHINQERWESEQLFDDIF